MKINIHKGLKTGLISIIVIIVGLVSFVLFTQIKYPGFQEEIVTLYNYNNKASVNYEVFLKPNILYEQRSLAEGQIYITEFVDYIKAAFNFEFSGAREADIHGTYEIIAVVAGTTKSLEGQDDTIIWQKNFIITPRKTFSVTDKTLSIKEAISLKLDEYNEFAKMVTIASKLDTDIHINVFMNINLTETTDKGTIEEKLSPSMVIPLNSSMFEVTGNLAEERPGNIQETKQIQLPVNKKQVIFYGVILCILISVLIFLVLFTKTAPEKDPLEKMLKLIFKKHGDRLVALNNDLVINTTSANQVKSIEDLVKIADEVGKPIMYKYSQDYKEINNFYVTNGDEIYMLDVKDVVAKEEIDTIDEFERSDFKKESKIEF